MINCLKMDCFRFVKSKSSWFFLVCQFVNALLICRIYGKSIGPMECYEMLIMGMNPLILISTQWIVNVNRKYNHQYIKNIFVGKRRYLVISDFIGSVMLVCIHFLIGLITSFICTLGKGLDKSFTDFIMYILCQIIYCVSYLMFIQFMCLMVKNKSLSLIIGIMYTMVFSLFIWNYLDKKLPFLISRFIVSQYIIEVTVDSVFYKGIEGLAVASIMSMFMIIINIKVLNKKEM